MNKIIVYITFIGVLLCKDSISQKTDTLKPIIFYPYSSSEAPFPFIIDNKWVSKKTFKKVEAADSIYSSDFKGLRLIYFKTLNDKLLYSYYSFGSDRGEPYGEYNEYHKNGRLKIKGYYKLPTENDSRSGVIDSVWNYYDQKGRLIGTKRYKNGLANGLWTAYNSKGKVIYKKYFIDGFSNDLWCYYKYSDKSDSYGLMPLNFYKGFYQGGSYEKDLFYSSMEKDENIKCDDYMIEVEKIIRDTAKISFPNKEFRRVSLSFIVSGKFYYVMDGIIIFYKEFKDGILVKKIEYDY